MLNEIILRTNIDLYGRKENSIKSRYSRDILFPWFYFFSYSFSFFVPLFYSLLQNSRGERLAGVWC